MSQGVIIRKLKRYYEIMSQKYKETGRPANIIEQEEQEEQAKERKALEHYIKNDMEKGTCYGLTIIHGVMAHTGVLAKWEAKLRAICAWDETEASLQNEITAKDETIKLNELLDEALNYVVFSQSRKSIYIPRRASNLFSRPSLEFYSNTDGEIIQPKCIQNVRGFFTTEYLIEFLEENKELFKDKLCRIANHNHIIRIAYQEDGSWMIYDPNFDHEENKNNPETPIYKTYSSTKDVAESVQRILCSKTRNYNGLNIEAVSFVDEFKLSHTKEALTNKRAAELIQHDGLATMAAQDTEGNLLTFIKKYSAHENPHREEFLSALSHALSTPTPRKVTALFLLVKENPPVILEILKLLNNESSIELEESLAKSIADSFQGPISSESIVTLFQFLLIRLNADELVEFFQLIKSNKIILGYMQEIFAKELEGSLNLLLDIDEDDEETDLSDTSKDDALEKEKKEENDEESEDEPENESECALIALLELVDESPSGQALLTAIANGIQKKDDSVQAFHFIICTRPKVLDSLIQLARNNGCLLSAINTALGLDTTQIRALIKQHLSDSNTDDHDEASRMLNDTKYKLSGFHLLVLIRPDILSELYELVGDIHADDNYEGKALQNLIARNIYHEPLIINSIAKNAPNQLMKMIKLCLIPGDGYNSMNYLLKALARRDDKGASAWDTISSGESKENVEPITQTILEFIDTLSLDDLRDLNGLMNGAFYNEGHPYHSLTKNKTLTHTKKFQHNPDSLLYKVVNRINDAISKQSTPDETPQPDWF